mmetsp:Transcript_42145/g.98846  ORF Transcript_42145/g.98846 Transcript_42145/m.98846 type:complete len:101 (-) Transcript_42145:204-506(-)
MFPTNLRGWRDYRPPGILTQLYAAKCLKGESLLTVAGIGRHRLPRSFYLSAAAGGAFPPQFAQANAAAAARALFCGAALQQENVCSIVASSSRSHSIRRQ